MNDKDLPDLITGVLYTKNSYRSVIPAGPTGSLGDQVIAAGTVFRDSACTFPVGTFDLTAFVTSVDDDLEKRQVLIGLSIDRSYVRHSWMKGLRGHSRKGLSSSAARQKQSTINLAGVATYPINGAILSDPIVLGVDAGTGDFVRTDGEAHISYGPSTQTFAYEFHLFNDY